MTRDAYLFDAARTPRGKGKPGGALSGAPPHDLLGAVLDALAERCGAEALSRVERMVCSTVTQAGAQGGHIGLVSRLATDRIPNDVPVLTINNFCAGGLSALHVAASEVRAGAAGLALAAGVECMSQAPFLSDHGAYYSDPALSDRLDYVPVYLSADYMAYRERIDREAMDRLALRSHQRAAAAWAEGRYAASVVPVRGADGEVLLDRDECVRPGLTLEALAALPAAFEEEGRSGYDARAIRAKPDLEGLRHTMTVGHCPPVADGAAAALIGDLETGRALGLRPIAKILHTREAAGDPVDQLTAGFAAMDAVLERAGLAIGDLDLVEFMEAFAPPPALFERNYDVDPARVNVNGGHIAMGHPMGATGLVLLASLAHEMRARGAGLGLVVAHGGSGVGSACILEAM